jgi:hypothetical protein
VTTTGAADATRAAGRSAKSTARKTAAKAKSTTTRQTRKVPGGARAEGTVKGAVAGEGDLPIARYDALNADEVTARLPELTQVELATVEAYERKGQDRTTILNRIGTLRGDEPWTGYDELTVDEIRSALSGADDRRVQATRTYERAHKNRAGVLELAERELARA